MAKLKSILVKGMAVATTCAFLLPIGKAHAAADQYEVKVFADADKVVKDNRHIDHDILEKLGSEDKDEDFNVQYIDDRNESNHQNGVTYRVRKSENDDTHEYQYKKRYPIENVNVDAAIDQAKADGFDGDEFEVEYGENKQTLSVTKEAEEDLNLDGTELPNASDSLKSLKSFASSPYDALLNKINDPKAVGPVHFERHKGKIDDNNVKIENWEIGNKNVVELSAKVNTESEAKAVQQSIVNKLDNLDIHETQDQLKTDLIFSTY